MEKLNLSVSLAQGTNTSPLNVQGSLFEEDSEVEEWDVGVLPEINNKRGYLAFYLFLEPLHCR